MAVPEQTPYIEYDGNGVSKVFPLTFDCEDSDHLIVKVNDEMPVVGAWSLVDEKVVFINAPAIDSKIVIQRNTPTKRSTTYNSYDNSFRPAPVDSDFDTIWRKLQELGVTNWLTDTDIKNLGIYVNSLNDETRDDFFNSLGNLEKNTNAMLEEAIANGAVSALAITTVETVDELEDLNAWEGRTVSVTSIGNYKYKSSTQTWERDFITDRQVVTVNSIAELLTLPMWEGRVVNVISYYQPDYSSPVLPIIEGGDLFRYVYSLRNINDSGVCINGWMRQKATYNYLTPEMFGAKGIGPTFDDQVPIQNMLNAGARGCTFDFDGAKTYYNAFQVDDKNVFIDHYEAAAESQQWIRTLGATFNFNGCKLTRRTPTGDIEDIPNKSKYSDNGSSLLLIKGAENIYFNNGNFDSSATLGTFVDTSNSEIIATKDLYYVADVGTHGIRLNNCKNVFFNNIIAEKAYFNIFVDGSENVFGNIITNYAIQCPIRSYAPNDMNLGAGLKVWFSRNVRLNVNGKRNANATAEIEKFNYDVEINGGSEYDYSNGMVIHSTKGVRFDWTSKNVINGTSLQILDGGTGSWDDFCSDIKGKLTSYQVGWCGLLITMTDACTQDFYGIEINVQTEISAYAGICISNKNATKVIKGCKIHHWSHNDNGTMKSRVFEGAITGDVKGGSSNTDYGLFVRGTNTKVACLRFELDLRECSVPWVVDSTAIAEFNNTITADNAFFISANVTQNFGSAESGMSYIGKGEIRFNQNVLHNKAAYSVFDNLNNAHGNERFRFYYDATSGVATTGGVVYPIKVFVPTV